MALEKKQITNLQPYKVASHKIWDVSPQERSNILKLDWNEATIPPSPLVHQRILGLLENPNFYQLYPATYSLELHEKLSDYAQVSKENLQYFPSSDSLHEYISTVFLGVNDTVLLLGPTYDNFRLTCEARGAKTEYFNYSESFEFDGVEFENRIINLQPKLVYICNPNNPTGNIVRANIIEGFIHKFPQVMFLIDEAYFEFSDETVKDFVTQYENLLVTRTLSKAFALANFRIGYLISSQTNIMNISKVRNPKNFTTFSQEATIAALSDVPYTMKYVDEVKLARNEFFEFLTQLNKGVKPIKSEGNFMLMQFNSEDTKLKFVQFMEEQNIFLRNLTHSPLLLNCLRITIGTEEQMKYVSSKIIMFFNLFGE